jgi:hypothetical protein
LEDATDGLPRAFAPHDADREMYETWQAWSQALESAAGRLPPLDAERLARDVLRRRRVRRSATLGRWTAIAAVLILGVSVGLAIRNWPAVGPQRRELAQDFPPPAVDPAAVWDDDADVELTTLDDRVSAAVWSVAHDRLTFCAFDFDLQTLWWRCERLLDLL